MASEDRQRFNLRTIRTTFFAAMASSPHLAEQIREKSGELLDRADAQAISDGMRGEIEDLRSEIQDAGGEQTG